MTRRLSLGTGDLLAPGGATPGGAPPASPLLPGFRVASHHLELHGEDRVAQAKGDLTALAARADLIGINQATCASPTTVPEWAAARPAWRHHQPSVTAGEPQPSGVDAVLWRDDVFALVDRGVRSVPVAVAAVPSDAASSDAAPSHASSGRAPRWLTWVTLHHRASGGVLTWVQVQMDRPTDGPREAAANLTAMGRLVGLVRERAAAGEVLVGGDWAVCARADRRRPDDARPFAVLEGRDDPATLPGLRSTYSFFGFATPATSGRPESGRYTDYVALLRRSRVEERSMSFESHRVLTGYRSAHRPVQAVVRVDPSRLHPDRELWAGV